MIKPMPGWVCCEVGKIQDEYQTDSGITVMRVGQTHAGRSTSRQLYDAQNQGTITAVGQGEATWIHQDPRTKKKTKRKGDASKCFKEGETIVWSRHMGTHIKKDKEYMLVHMRDIKSKLAPVN